MFENLSADAAVTGATGFILVGAVMATILVAWVVIKVVQAAGRFCVMIARKTGLSAWYYNYTNYRLQKI